MKIETFFSTLEDGFTDVKDSHLKHFMELRMTDSKSFMKNENIEMKINEFTLLDYDLPHLIKNKRNLIELNPSYMDVRLARRYMNEIDPLNVESTTKMRKHLEEAMYRASLHFDKAYISFLNRKCKIPVSQVLHKIVNDTTYQGYRDDVQEAVEFLCQNFKVQLEKSHVDRILFTKTMDQDLSESFFIALPALNIKLLKQSMLSCAIYGYRMTAEMLFEKCQEKGILNEADILLYRDLTHSGILDEDEASQDPILMILRCASRGLPLPSYHLQKAIKMAIDEKNKNALDVLYGLRNSRLIDKSSCDLIELCYYLRNRQERGVRSRIMHTQHSPSV